MKTTTIVTIGVAGAGWVLAIAGWIVNFLSTTKRDQLQKRRNISIEHLIKAYRVLTVKVSHNPNTEEWAESFIQTLADIQLFGSQKQCDIVAQMSKKIASGEKFELDDLINSLRNDLREELNLSKLNGNVSWVRYKSKTK